MINWLKRLLRRTPMARSTRAYAFALEKLSFPPQARVLDLGAGSGAGTAFLGRRLPEACVVGLDITMESLDRRSLPATPRPLHFVQASATALPFEDGCLDGVMAVMTFHCLPKPQQVFREVARALKPGGLFVLADVDGRHWIAPFFELVEHLFISPLTHAYRPEEVRALAQQAGFTRVGIHHRDDREQGFLMWAVLQKGEAP